jgi:hypothetical protein
MAFRFATFASVVGVAAAGACTDDEAGALGDAWNTGENANTCGHKAFSIFSGFNHDKFNECFTAAMGISTECSECYAVTGDYGAKNCKGGCISGWCKSSCLSCTQPAQDSLGDCTGFAPTPADPCDGPSPPPPPLPYGQTITPSSNTELCLDVPSDSAFDGNSLWLWECNGGESQLWLFDNWQIRFAADESKCIDSGDMSDGTQLYLWDCNGSPQQSWGFDGDQSTVYLSDTSTCLDYYGDWASNGQPLHIWECSGDWNQQWSVWDQGKSTLSV